MMEKMIALQQKRRSKKGGFTLVELIVVLVILAILAALLIPALTGYIDKAKQKKIVAETRQCVWQHRRCLMKIMVLVQPPSLRLLGQLLLVLSLPLPMLLIWQRLRIRLRLRALRSMMVKSLL